MDVTGGMLTKVQAMVSLVSSSHVRRVHLISGGQAGALADVLLDEGKRHGTVIEQADEERERN